jgi:type IV pilus assembly protein PilE
MQQRFAKIKGFTLIELMVVVAVIGILAAIAFPSYAEYMRRSRASTAVAEMATYSIRMEQFYLDRRNYGSETACGVAPPTAQNYEFACVLTASGQGFTLTGTAKINQEGVYVVREGDQRSTTKLKGAAVTKNCWVINGSEC